MPDMDDFDDVFSRQHSIEDLESVPSNNLSVYATNGRRFGRERIPSDEFYRHKRIAAITFVAPAGLCSV
jgi:hypothetical protein